MDCVFGEVILMDGPEDDILYPSEEESEQPDEAPPQKPQSYKKSATPQSQPDNTEDPIIEGYEDQLTEQRRLNTVMLLSDMQELGTDIDLASTYLGTIWTEKQRDELNHLVRNRSHKAAFDECYNYLMDAGRESKNAQTVLFSLKSVLNRLSEKIRIMDNI